MFYMHHSADWGWGWWILMTLGMIAFWGALLYAVVWLVRGERPASADRQPSPESPDSSESPEEILKRRLAAGEISVEEYERLQEALQDRPRAGPVAAGPPGG